MTEIKFVFKIDIFANKSFRDNFRAEIYNFPLGSLSVARKFGVTSPEVYITG